MFKEYPKHSTGIYHSTVCASYSYFELSGRPHVAESRRPSFFFDLGKDVLSSHESDFFPQ